MSKTTPEKERNDWPDNVRLHMIEKSNFYSEPAIYQYGYYDGYHDSNLNEEIARLKAEMKSMNAGVLTDEEIQRESERLYPNDLGKQVSFCEALVTIKSRVEHKIKVGLLDKHNVIIVRDGTNEMVGARIAMTESAIVIYIN